MQSIYHLFSSVWLQCTMVLMRTRQVLLWLLTVLRSCVVCNFLTVSCFLFTLHLFFPLRAVVSLLPLQLCNTWYSEQSVSIVAPPIHRRPIQRLRKAQVHSYKVLPPSSFSEGSVSLSNFEESFSHLCVVCPWLHSLFASCNATRQSDSLKLY